GDRRFHPKIHNPRKVDSRKNASRPSIASGAPNTSPTNREYEDQFIPNWNSCTMPVTTPRAKLTRKSLPQNRVIRRYVSLPVRYQAVCMTATRKASPIESGTNRKWNPIVTANCHLDRSSASIKPSSLAAAPWCPRRAVPAEAVGPALEETNGAPSTGRMRGHDGSRKGRAHHRRGGRHRACGRGTVPRARRPRDAGRPLGRAAARDRGRPRGARGPRRRPPGRRPGGGRVPPDGRGDRGASRSARRPRELRRRVGGGTYGRDHRGRLGSHDRREPEGHV